MSGKSKRNPIIHGIQVTFVLANLLWVGSIVLSDVFGSSERVLTAEEIEAGCQEARQRLQSAEDKYSGETQELTDHYAGTRVNYSMLEDSYATLKPLADELAQQKNNANWWCEGVKPGTRVKDEGDTLSIIEDDRS